MQVGSNLARGLCSLSPSPLDISPSDHSPTLCLPLRLTDASCSSLPPFLVPFFTSPPVSAIICILCHFGSPFLSPSLLIHS
ncbi:unnamed protein product [Protopolystoma xenopodis]|uniref:Uncharacterized protein n=1 Tax=Protopolystoma xenopodis TaxID=117903 RepID=A0A3S5B7I0_9PLAT|nr:unnamed protein product [Protopolystoma xenopodis]